jgi:AsmA protein
MNAGADRRRPFVAALALCALICVGLVIPLLLAGPDGDLASGGKVRAASPDSITLTWPVTLLNEPSIVLERGTVTLADAGSSKSRGARLLALLTGDGADLILDNAKLTIGRSEIEPAGTAASSIPASMEPVVAALKGLNFQTLYLNDVSAVVRSKGRADESLEGITGEISKDSNGAVKAKLKFVLRGEKLSADMAMASRIGAADAPVPLRFALKGKHLDLKLDGRLVSGERLQVTAQNAELNVPNLRQAARWLDPGWPAGQGLGAFAAQGPVVIEERSMAFENAHFSLDGNAATGALSLTLNRDRPSLEGTLAFDSLDVAPYITTQKTDVLSLAGGWFANLRIPGSASPSLVRQLDADLRISARSVAVGSDRFGRCAASVSIKDGKLLGELAEMELEQGGTGEGQVGVDMTTPEPRYTLRASLQDVDMKAIGTHLGGPAIEGSGDLSIDLAGEGATAAEIVSSLSGNLALEMREGARLGMSVDALAAMSDAAPDSAGWGNVMGSSTAVDTLVARFTATRGVFTAGDIEAANADRTIKALGTLSASDRLMDVTVSVVPGTAQAPAKAGDPAQPPAYRVQGPWAAPSISKVPPPGKSALPLPPGELPDRSRG